VNSKISQIKLMRIEHLLWLILKLSLRVVSDDMSLAV
jgi:hypothetical protein